MRFSYGQFSLDLPNGWMDTTEEAEPFTLSKSDGVGALQFSVAIYGAGKRRIPPLANSPTCYWSSPRPTVSENRASTSKNAGRSILLLHPFTRTRTPLFVLGT